MIAQVAAASEEQSSTTEQIGRSIDSIATVTNESAAGVSQIARAADDLNRLTENLRGLVASFQTGASGNSVPVRDHSATRPASYAGGDGMRGVPVLR